METALIIVSLLCAALGAWLYICQRRIAAADTALNSAERDKALMAERLKNVQTECERLRAEAMKGAEHKDAERRMQSEQFELLARRVLDSRGEELRRDNLQQIEQILAPLKEDIGRFRTQVSECYATEARERFSLQERIKELVEANRNIGREARELSTALRGNTKMQGDWGEMVLESILEKSGLRRGEEFEIQASTDETGAPIRNESGALLRPDVIVRYPDRGVMVIDSKVSLTAFVDYVNCTDEAMAAEHARRHMESVMKHIRELSDKSYHRYVGKGGKLDFVMMFIPNESAYATALNMDPELWQKAYDRHVVIASPTQLVGALRLVAQLWRHDRQTANALEIARKSGLMYDKFVGFVDDMLRVERSLEATGSALHDAMNKLRDGRGNLISRAEKLRELGIKTSKHMPATNALPEDADGTDSQAVR
ncbi:MAG: DNA recombination protein RmuC [Muribaculaceae bacterium]|nr:DNA recombination protein RmuC [Muribaculaceae bacterium]